MEKVLASKSEIRTLCELTHSYEYYGRKLSKTFVLNKIARLTGKDKKWNVKKKKFERGLYEYLLNNVDIILGAIFKSIRIEGKVIDDPKFFPNSKRCWTIVGSGCAFVSIKNIGRFEKAKAIYEAKDNVIPKIMKKVLVRIPLKVRKDLERKGCPLEALFMQDEIIQVCYMNLICDYMKKVCGENFNGYVDSRLD